MKRPDPHRQQTTQILKKVRTSTAQKQRETNLHQSRLAFSDTCAYTTNTAQITAEDKQEWQTAKWKKFGKTMMAKAWVESIRQLTGRKSMQGKLATFPDVRLVYHESGRWKLLAGYQKDESREEVKKEDHHDTETALSGWDKEMADTPHRRKVCWSSGTSSSKEREWDISGSYNESQKVSQMKMECPTANGAVHNFRNSGSCIMSRGEESCWQNTRQTHHEQHPLDITKGWPTTPRMKKMAGAQKQASPKNTKGSASVFTTKINGLAEEDRMINSGWCIARLLGSQAHVP